MKNRSPESLPYKMLFLNPWGFWGMLLSTSRGGSLVGTSVIFILLVTLYYFLPKTYTWWGIGLFLVWIGPILFFLPLLFMAFVLPSIIYGDNWNVPIGCVRNKETGKLDCI